MGKPFLAVIESLAGGLNESAAEQIQANELALCNNLYADGPSLKQREDDEEVAGPYTEEILSVFRYKPSFDSVQTLLLGCASSVARVVDEDIEAIEVSDGRVYQESVYRWFGKRYKDEFFLCQRNNGGVKRMYGASIQEAGITAPLTPPTAADVGPGKKIAGVYRFAFRYYNTTTGARSNWSPLSTEVEIADNHRVLMQSITPSTNPQVNARQIGATKPGGAVVYLVGQINDNVSTTFYENAIDPDEYGEADIDLNGQPTTDLRNGNPPSQAWALEVHKERLVVGNGDGISWSEAGLPQSFKAASFIPVSKLTGLLSWDLHGLVIPTEENVEILLGDTPSDWRKDVLSGQHRCPAGKSMAIGDGTLFWYTGVNIVASGGGAPTILPRIERIRETLDSIPDAQKYDVVGGTIPGKGLYILSVPTDDGRKVIVYDYVQSSFAVFPDGPKTLDLILGDDGSETVYAAFEDPDFSLYTFLTADTGAKTARLRTGKIGGQDSHRIVRRVSVHGPAANGTATLRIYADDVLVATRSGISMNKAEPKRITVRSSSRPGSFVQADLEYSGTDRWQVDRLQLEGVELRRRVKTI